MQHLLWTTLDMPPLFLPGKPQDGHQARHNEFASSTDSSVLIGMRSEGPGH